MEDILKIIEYIKEEFFNYQFITDTSHVEYIMITIKNPNGKRNIYIKFYYHDEITLFFDKFECSYNYIPDDFEIIIKTIQGIIDGKYIAVSVSGLKYDVNKNVKQYLLSFSLEDIINFNNDSFIQMALTEYPKVIVSIIGWNTLDCKLLEY